MLTTLLRNIKISNRWPNSPSAVNITEAYRTEDSLVFSSLQNRRFSCLQLFTEHGLHEISYLTNESPLKENAEFVAANIHQKQNKKKDTLFFKRHNTSPLRDHTC